MLNNKAEVDIDSIISKILVTTKKPLSYYCGMLGIKDPVTAIVDVSILNGNYSRMTFLRSYPVATEAFTFLSRLYDVLKEAITCPDSQAYALLENLSTNNIEVNYLAFSRLINAKSLKHLNAKRRCMNFEVLFHREESDRISNVAAISDISPNKLKSFDMFTSCTHKVLIDKSTLTVHTSESKLLSMRPKNILFAYNNIDYEVIQHDLVKLAERKRASENGDLDSAMLFLGQFGMGKIKFGDLYIRNKNLKCMKLPDDNTECKWNDPQSGRVYTEVLPAPISVEGSTCLYKSKHQLVNALGKKITVFLEVTHEV